jgi:hypothetical protein
MRRDPPAWLVVGMPTIIFCVQAWFFREWIIDDAGISYVYARNLAEGAGLVAQPGQPPVEAYSNPAWVLFLALFFKLGIFHPVFVPKLLSVVLTMGTFVALRVALIRLDLAGPRLQLVVFALIATNSSFVIWCTSGLENPLLAALAALLFAITASAVARDAPSNTSAFAGGVIAALLALTRPDGTIYFVAYPVAVAIVAFVRRRSSQPFRVAWFPHLAIHTAPIIAIWGAHLLFRWRYFGELVPNTYYVKGGPSGDTVLSVVSLGSETTKRLHELMSSVAQPIGGVLLLASPFFVTVLLVARRIDTPCIVLAWFAAVAGLDFLLMPSDWMGEYRFATVFIVFGLALIVVLAHRGVAILRSGRPSRVASVAAGLAVLVSLGGAVYRSRAFLQNPTLSFQRVEREYARKFNRYAEALGMTDASFLLPDLGGTLYSSHLRIYDMAGLCDKTIAKTLHPHVGGDEGKDFKAFHEYVFGQVRPTFIHIHGYWTRSTRLWSDPRFSAEYVPIFEHLDKSVYKHHLVDMRSGDYVRRDALRSADALAKMRVVRDEFGVCWDKEICDPKDIIPDAVIDARCPDSQAEHRCATP